MFTRALTLLTLAALSVAFLPREALAQDVGICFITAERVANGERVEDEDKRAGHEACQRALAQTSSIVQKYQIQEADFEIVGRPPKTAN
jgi:hypothetical protein